MKNPFQSKEWSVGKIILIVWLVFSIGFVGLALRNYVVTAVYQQGLRNGQDAAITEIMARAAKCEPVTLFAGQGEDRKEVTMVNSAECEAPVATEEAPAVE
jgi:hypothetical protein